MEGKFAALHECAYQRGFQVLGCGWDDALGANAHRDVIKQGLSELLLDWSHILLRQVGAQQAHSAVNVKANASRRHHSFRVAHINCYVGACASEWWPWTSNYPLCARTCSYVSNRKAIA